MKCLLFANSGLLFTPIVSQAVLAEFVSTSVSDGLGAKWRKYTYTELEAFFQALSPLFENAKPVGLRDVYPLALRNPGQDVRRLISDVVAAWPSGVDRSVLQQMAKDVDPKDLHVAVAALEHMADVIVTSNLEHLEFMKGVCEVEPPSVFLDRFV
jgi:hypothetical protein